LAFSIKTMTVKDDHDDDENYLAVDINKAKQDDC
jgi:hypothetical protein